MTQAVPQELFWELVGEFVDQANAMSKSHSAELVGTAMMYAASRYHTHIVARSSKDLEDFSADEDNALAFFRERYEAMFKENFADHKNNYNEYLKRN